MECRSNVGECSSGAFQCDDSCVCICIGEVAPVAEICDGLDNDCDGAIDDGNPEAGGQCGIDIGECQAGTLQCQGGEIACIGAINPAVEICDDGLDTDCDGLVDCLDTDCDTDAVCAGCIPNPCGGGQFCLQGQCFPVP